MAIRSTGNSRKKAAEPKSQLQLVLDAAVATAFAREGGLPRPPGEIPDNEGIPPSPEDCTLEPEAQSAGNKFPGPPLESPAESLPAAPNLAEGVDPQRVTDRISHPSPEVAPSLPEPTWKEPVEPIPARMLNEYVYCPRLFYYEHIEGVFVHNADTLRGSANHQRVDRGDSSLPPIREGVLSSPPAERADAPEMIHSHSVSLGSDRLGVTAKLDLVEARYAAAEEALPAENKEDGFSNPPSTLESDLLMLTVCPVEYKNGAPREGEAGNEIWPADRMQLGLQILLLRDNGYQCERGVLYYRATRQRITLDYSAELETWIVGQIGAARQTMSGSIPPPLVDSPKCPRCSLVTVCLPDETRLLVQPSVSARAPRALAARDERRALYLNTPGLHLGRSNEVLQVRDKKAVIQEVRLSDVSHVALFGNIQISTQTIQALCEQDVPASYFSMGGWFYGITRGHSLTNVLLRIEQFRLARDPSFALRLAREFVRGKIRNHRTLLMRNHLEPPEPAIQRLRVAQTDLDRAASLGELLGMEGAAAAVYFKHFGGLIKVAEDIDPAAAAAPGQRHFNFDFEGRNRRPPTDPVNALLSLAYSLLVKDCTIAALAVGFDPYVGFYHQPRHGRPALALDLMEEFRPLIAESAVITAINNRMVTPKDFVSAGRAVNLTPTGRKHFFEAYEKRMNDTIVHPVFDYKVSYRRALELQFRILARVLTGEIPDYLPFMTR